MAFATAEDLVKKYIETKRSRIAESTFVLRSKPFCLKTHPHYYTIYDINHPPAVIMSDRQVGKTALGCSIVTAYNGRPNRLDAMHIGDSVISMTDDYRLVEGRVIDTIYSGKKPALKITTRLGHVLDIATTHPVRMFLKYCVAGQIQVGDRIAAVRRGGSFTGTSVLSQVEVMILAYMIGDGSTQGRQNFGFINKKPVIIEEFLSACAALGQKEPRIYERNGSTMIRLSLAVDAPVRLLIERNGLYGHKSATKFVPDEVFDLEREMTALFINRLWACDGTVKQNRPGQYDISFCSISERLIRGLQALLWKFGIPTSVRTKIPPLYMGTNKVAYILRVETQEGVRRFLAEVGALGKSEGVPLPDVESNNNRDTIPQEVQEIIDRLYRKAKMNGRVLYRGSGKFHANKPAMTAAGLRPKLKYPPTPQKIQAYADFFRAIGMCDDKDVELLYAIAKSDIIWDEIVLIEDVGEQECYDLEVETYNNYVLNGVVTHNSTTECVYKVAEWLEINDYHSLNTAPSLDQNSVNYMKVEESDEGAKYEHPVSTRSGLLNG